MSTRHRDEGLDIKPSKLGSHAGEGQGGRPPADQAGSAGSTPVARSNRPKVCTGKDCVARIVWAETPNGKEQPFDRVPAFEGARVLIGRGPDRLPLAISPTAIAGEIDLRGALYMPHHATCPNAHSFRRKR